MDIKGIKVNMNTDDDDYYRCTLEIHIYSSHTGMVDATTFLERVMDFLKPIQTIKMEEDF